MRPTAAARRARNTKNRHNNKQPRPRLLRFESLENRALLSASGSVISAAEQFSTTLIGPIAPGQASSPSAAIGSAEATDVTPSLVSGTWSTVTTNPFGGLGTMMLLSDGTVMAQRTGTSNLWYRLTPSSTGSYTSGTWSALPSMSLQRLYFASNVLTNGNVLVVGGEYSGSPSSQNWINSGEVFDPVAGTWTATPNFPKSSFGDDPSAMLPDGTVLAGYVSGTQTYIYNPTTNSWSQTGSKIHGDRSDEETWVTLPDGSILSYDVFASSETGTGSAQRYIPSTGKWVDAGVVPVPLTGSAFGSELGPALRVPDGRIFLVGANNNTVLYHPDTNTWETGPQLPANLGADDAPGAELPDGHVIFAADTSSPTIFTKPSRLFDFDPVTNTISEFTSLPSQLRTDLNRGAYNLRMLLLPTGQVMLSFGSSRTWVFTPSDSPIAASAPQITSVVQKSDGSYLLTGTQLNGISEGASYGDDAEMSSNYPLVRLRDGSGHVYYARTFNWSSTAVATGSTPVTTQFTMPAGLPSGSYSLEVVANGIASTSIPFTSPLNVVSSTPTNGGVVTTSPTSYSVTFNVAISSASLQASDLTVNGHAATGVSLSGDGKTATFTFTTNPISAPGTQTISLAEGAVAEQSSTSILSTAFNAQFTLSASALSITSTTPAAGGVFTLPGPFTFDVNFNEAINPASVSTSTLGVVGISGASVTGATVLPGNTTARFTISGISLEGILSLSIAAGAVTSAGLGDGNPAFAANYSVDASTVALAVPVTAMQPAGSLVYNAASIGYIGTNSDTDSFTIALNPNERVTVIITPTSGQLQPSLTLRDPSNASIGTASASGIGQAAVAQSIATTTGGTYTIVVSGINSSTGGYNVQVILNAATEVEGILSGTSDNTTGTAQDLAGSAYLLQGGTGPQRLAVIGTTEANTSDYYKFTASAADVASIVLKVLAAGSASVALYDANQILVASSTTGPSNVTASIDRVTLSAGGVYYLRVTGSAGLNYNLVVTQNAAFNLEPNDSRAFAQPIGGTGGVLGYTGSGDDDWYSVAVTDGPQLINLATYTPSSGAGEFHNTLVPTIELYKPDGSLAVAGTVGGDGHNQTLTYVASAPGTYTVRVAATGGTQGAYFLGAAVTPTATYQTVVVDNGTAQRSMVRSLTVTFAGTVGTAPAAAFTLTRDSDSLSIPVAVSAVTPISGGSSVTLTFSGPSLVSGSLPNGRYTLSIDGSAILDAGGRPIDAANSGVPGSATTATFFRLQGDGNGDGVVNAADITLVASNWLSAGPAGDVNTDGIVNAADITLIASSWLTQISDYDPPSLPNVAAPATTTVALSAATSSVETESAASESSSLAASPDSPSLRLR